LVDIPISVSAKQLEESVLQYGAVKDDIQNLNDRFEYSVNLYNENTNTDGYVISKDGVLTENAQYTTTDFIYLEKSQYTMTYEDTKQFAFISKFNLNKEFIKREGTSGSFEITEDCYVRLSGYISRTAGKDIMLVKGTELPTEYVPYSVKIKQEYLPEIEINTSDDLTVSIADTDFVKTSANLINQMTIEKGKVLSSTGVKSDTSEYNITDKIYLQPNTTYTCIYCQRVCYFDKEGNFKKSTGLSQSQKEAYSFTTPDEFEYAIVNLYAKQSKWQLNEGTELLPYEPQHLIINGYRLYDEPFVQWNENFVDNSMPFLLEEDFDTPTGKADNEKTTSAILSYYDELVSLNPEYITKTQKTVTTENGTQTLVRYDFIEPNGDSSGEFFTQNKTKIILSSGTHREFAGIYGLYNAMKQITNNPALIDIRRNVHFIVIPVLNPYGVENGVRGNANGVDIARNFERGWFASNPTNSDGTPNKTYGGTAPLTEPESVYLDSVFKENTDALFYASCHSFQYNKVNGVEKPNQIMWCASATSYVNNIGSKVVDKVSRLLREKYADVDFENGNNLVNVPTTLLGLSNMNAPGGSEGQQASKYQIQGCTFETCDWCRFNDNRQTEGYLTDFAILRACEVYINLLLVVCQISNNQKVDLGDIESAFEDYVEKILGGIENGSY
jgi:hypothetical protein